jgi:hypothetical protein
MSASSSTRMRPCPIGAWYDSLPEGIHIKTVSLSISQLTDDVMDKANKVIERGALAVAGASDSRYERPCIFEYRLTGTGKPRCSRSVCPE